MNKQQREVYHAICDAARFSLCDFCRYSETSGSICSGDCDRECKHPLQRVAERQQQYMEDNLEDPYDCWAFRPEHSIDFLAGIIGAHLEHGWESCEWWKNHKGVWRVAGQAPSERRPLEVR